MKTTWKDSAKMYNWTGSKQSKPIIHWA